MKQEETYTLKQASELLGVQTGVLRRLCNAGLIPRVRRNKHGYRILENWQIELAGILIALRQAGLERVQLKRYARLACQGEETLVERKAMLETQKRQLWQELEDRQRGIDLLERQIELIDRATL